MRRLAQCLWALLFSREHRLYKSLISVRVGENGNILGGAGELAHPESFAGKSDLGGRKEQLRQEPFYCAYFIEI